MIFYPIKSRWMCYAKSISGFVEDIFAPVVNGVKLKISPVTMVWWQPDAQNERIIVYVYVDGDLCFGFDKEIMFEYLILLRETMLKMKLSKFVGLLPVIAQVDGAGAMMMLTNNVSTGRRTRVADRFCFIEKSVDKCHYSIGSVRMNRDTADLFTTSVRSDKYIEYSKEFKCPKVLSRSAVPGCMDPYYGTLTTDTECPTGRVSDGVDHPIVVRVYLRVGGSMRVATHNYIAHVWA